MMNTSIGVSHETLREARRLELAGLADVRMADLGGAERHAVSRAARRLVQPDLADVGLAVVGCTESHELVSSSTVKLYSTLLENSSTSRILSLGV